MTTTDPHPSTEHPPDENRALVVTPSRPSAAVELWGTDNPRDMTARMGAIADAISAVIESRQLFTVIQGRKYVQVEGWSMVGAMVGVFPRTTRTAVLETGHLDALTVTRWNAKERREYQKTYPAHDGVIAYAAHVELVTRDGGVIGGAEAMCSRREEQWRDRDDNQIASMSQTRAVAKAYRMTFGFVMPMSGYAPTPAEEMTEVVDASFREVEAHPPQSRAPRERPPQADPTVEPSSEGISNVGQLLTYGGALRRFHGMPVDGRAVLDALGVQIVGEITARYRDNWAGAAARIHAAFTPGQTSEPPSDDGAAQPTLETPDERIARLTPDERQVYDGFIAEGVEPTHALLAMGLG